MHIVHTEASHGWGGQEIRILSEAQGVMARGHRVTLIAPKAATIHGAAKARGIAVVDLPIGRKSLKGFLAMRRWLAAHRPDVVNTHSSTDSWLACLAARTLPGRIPVVRTRHISAPVSVSLSNKWLYGAAVKRVVTTGESLRVDLYSRLNLPPEHFISIPTGIDLERFSPASAEARLANRRRFGIPDHAFVAGIAATLRSWKGHLYLIEAFEMLAAEAPDAHLAIAGDGPQRAAIEQRIAESPHARRMHFLGHQEDVPSFMAMLDVFVLPSYANEGVPQAIMQAMACALPVISTFVGAIDEVVTDGETGYLCAPHNAAEIHRRLRHLSLFPDLRKAFAAAALDCARRRFSTAGMVDRMTTVFSAATTGK